MTRHPYLLLSTTGRLLLLLLFMTGTLFMMLHLQEHGRPLYNPEACLGIVSLELPFTAEKAGEVLASWRGNGIEIAIENIRKDFLFILIYPLAFSIALAIAADFRTTGWRNLYSRFSWIALLMMPLDIAENLLMLRMIESGPTVITAPATSLAASTKFLILLASSYLLLRALLRPCMIWISKLLGGKLGQS